MKYTQQQRLDIGHKLFTHELTIADRKAIIVISKFKRLNEYLALRRNCSGEMVRYGNIRLIKQFR